MSTTGTASSTSKAGPFGGSSKGLKIVGCTVTDTGTVTIFLSQQVNTNVLKALVPSTVLDLTLNPATLAAEPFTYKFSSQTGLTADQPASGGGGAYAYNSADASIVITLKLDASMASNIALTEGEWIQVGISGWSVQNRQVLDPKASVYYTRITSGPGTKHQPVNGAVRESIADLQSFPILTEAMPAGMISTSTPSLTPGAVGGTSALATTADRAIREVLSWRTNTEDAKGFLGALNQSFGLKEVEGHTEWNWTPRSYTVQTDMGAVTGAQASIYTRAKVALDQSLPLLDGLYPLTPNVEAEDLASVQAVVRTQFTALVNEFGIVGGPRVPRVDELFELLLGHDNPTNPEHIKQSGSLGLIRQRFGLERRNVNTVDDEQNLTNYMIMADYVIGLKQGWQYDKGFFVRLRNGETIRQPFFGTQLVLISRALEVVAQGVQDAYFAMDSVFMGDAERQTTQLNFADVEVWIPDPETGGPEPYQFPPDTSGLFVSELLDWVYSSASQELPGLLQDAGKDGLHSFRSASNRLRKFVHAAVHISEHARGLPPGFGTPRVKRAFRLLADGLDEAYSSAVAVHSPDLPVELSADELKQIRAVILNRKGI